MVEKDMAREAREEEATASRLQAEARLARERHQDDRADELEAEAETHGRLARNARESSSRAGRQAEDRAIAPVTDRLLTVAGRLVGRELTRSDLSAATGVGLAEEIAGAAERLLQTMERERDVTLMLQRSLLPEALPLMDGVRLAAAFRPADDLVGGDWYDAFRLPGDRLAFALGDVVGHGLEAAAAAVELRTTLRTHALQDPDPAFVAERLNELASVRHLLSYSSFVYGVIDPVSGVLDLVSLGHPPVLLRDARGTVAAIPTVHPLLSVEPAGTSFPATMHRIAPGATLIAYTDGLIERRRGNDETRVMRLAEILAGDGAPEDIVAKALEALASGPADDDIAVLCLALTDP